MEYTFKTSEELDRARNEYFTHSFRDGYAVFEGFTLPIYFAEFAMEIDEFEVYDDDVWLTCFPKTGSTWSRQMIWYIANDLDDDGAKEPLPFRFPFLEFCSIFDFRKYAQENKDFVPMPLICDSIKMIREAKRPRFIYTHLPWNLLPKQIRTFEKKPKIIHIARNSKDTCVSYFHHSKLIEGYTGNFEDFWQLFIANKVNFTPFWGNVLSYWNKRDYDNVLFITYEGMKDDLAGTISTVAKFLGKKFNSEQMDRLMSKLNYESMKITKAHQFEPIVDFLKQLNLCQNESGHFMRAGLIGNYRAQMCADVIEIFDRWARNETNGTGLKFDLSKFIKK